MPFVIRHKETGTYVGPGRYTSAKKFLEHARLFSARHHAEASLKRRGPFRDKYEAVEVEIKLKEGT